MPQEGHFTFLSGLPAARGDSNANFAPTSAVSLQMTGAIVGFAPIREINLRVPPPGKAMSAGITMLYPPTA